MEASAPIYISILVSYINCYFVKVRIIKNTAKSMHFHDLAVFFTGPYINIFSRSFHLFPDLPDPLLDLSHRSLKMILSSGIKPDLHLVHESGAFASGFHVFDHMTRPAAVCHERDHGIPVFHLRRNNLNIPQTFIVMFF